MKEQHQSNTILLWAVFFMKQNIYILLFIQYIPDSLFVIRLKLEKCQTDKSERTTSQKIAYNCLGGFCVTATQSDSHVEFLK